MFAQIDQSMVVLFAIAIMLSFFLLFFLFWLSIRVFNRAPSLSPYTSYPLRKAQDLSYYYKLKIYEYLEEIESYENRKFPFDSASFCRETMRIFTNSITWYGIIYVDWNFITKRYPGSYVSYGSLTEQQKAKLLEIHGSLDGFQTEHSSPESSPRMVAPEYAFTKPGPLYVDLETNTLVGWKIVPGTDVEVLVVQKPRIQRKETTI